MSAPKGYVFNCTKGEGGPYGVKIVRIGEWNMDADDTISVLHGSNFTRIRAVLATVYNDTEDKVYSLSGHDGLTIDGTIEYVDSTYVVLTRKPGGEFDSGDFDSTEINRGWITIIYQECEH